MCSPGHTGYVQTTPHLLSTSAVGVWVGVVVGVGVVVCVSLQITRLEVSVVTEMNNLGWCPSYVILRHKPPDEKKRV